MKLPATITLNGATVTVELELPDDLFTPKPAPVFVDDAALRSRWECSPRSTYRLRQTRRIPFTQPTPGKYLYRLSDVEAFEREMTTQARPIVRVARRAS